MSLLKIGAGAWMAATFCLLVVNGFSPGNLPASRFSTSTSTLGVAIDTSEIKNGLTLELEGEPYKVLGFSIMKQARGAAKTTIKLKNLMRGNTLENTYRSGEKFETAEIVKSNHIFSYADGSTLFFMNSETFEEVAVESKVVGDMLDLLDEGIEASLVFFKGKCIECILPKSCVYTIVECAPNTNKGNVKPLLLSSGATISGPGYIESGERIRVDTEKREYLGRDS